MRSTQPPNSVRLFAHAFGIIAEKVTPSLGLVTAGVSVNMKVITLLFLTVLMFGCSNEGQMISVNPDRVSQLEALLEEKKFVESSVYFYPGAPDEVTRLQAELVINAAIVSVLKVSESEISEDEFWGIIEVAARALSVMDSEEMDRGFTYFEQIMDVFEIASSGGRLNQWRYGFDPTIQH